MCFNPGSPSRIRRTSRRIIEPPRIEFETTECHREGGAAMITGRDLTLVTERDERLRAFEAFERAFAAGADLFRDRVVGFQSGSFKVDVHWHGSAGIWGAFRRQPQDPQSKKLLAYSGTASELPTRTSTLRSASRSRSTRPMRARTRGRPASSFAMSWGAYTSRMTEGSEVAGPASADRRSANLPRTMPRISNGKRW
jgi:hypothetical protein